MMIKQLILAGLVLGFASACDSGDSERDRLRRELNEERMEDLERENEELKVRLRKSAEDLDEFLDRQADSIDKKLDGVQDRVR